MQEPTIYRQPVVAAEPEGYYPATGDDQTAYSVGYSYGGYSTSYGAGYNGSGYSGDRGLLRSSSSNAGDESLCEKDYHDFVIPEGMCAHRESVGRLPEEQALWEGKIGS